MAEETNSPATKASATKAKKTATTGRFTHFKNSKGNFVAIDISEISAIEEQGKDKFVVYLSSGNTLIVEAKESALIE